MLVAVGNRKGGVGKTTLATNLAAHRAKQGHTVMFIDADSDEYGYMWGSLRRNKGHEPTILLSKMTGPIYADLMAARDAFDTVIVDVGGKNSPELVFAAGACDVLVVPAEAGQYDVWSLTAMATMIREMHASGKTYKVVPVMNKISADDRNTLTEGLKNEFDKLKDALGPEPHKIVRRNSYSWAAAEGRGITEMPRNRDTEKAQDEILSLYERIFA
jgi:chromosome partitioning protein